MRRPLFTILSDGWEGPSIKQLDSNRLSLHQLPRRRSEEKISDADLLPEIVARHKASYKVYPNVLAADTGFRADAEEMAALEKIIDNVAVPGRGLSRKKIETYLHHFRAGIEGSISALKRAFRLMICMYRGFKSFASAVGMAVFCHNPVNLIPKRVSA